MPGNLVGPCHGRILDLARHTATNERTPQQQGAAAASGIVSRLAGASARERAQRSASSAFVSEDRFSGFVTLPSRISVVDAPGYAALFTLVDGEKFRPPSCSPP